MYQALCWDKKDEEVIVSALIHQVDEEMRPTPTCSGYIDEKIKSCIFRHPMLFITQSLNLCGEKRSFWLKIELSFISVDSDAFSDHLPISFFPFALLKLGGIKCLLLITKETTNTYDSIINNNESYFLILRTASLQNSLLNLHWSSNSPYEVDVSIILISLFYRLTHSIEVVWLKEIL